MRSKISLTETALLPFVTSFRMIVVHKLLLIINFYPSGRRPNSCWGKWNVPSDDVLFAKINKKNDKSC